MDDNFPDQFIQVGDFRARYWKAGNAGAPVVLLAGIGCSVLEWRRNIAALAEHHQVYALDMLGDGMTDKPQGDHYGIASLARFTFDFMTVLGAESAHIIGNSLGGRIALECARIAPARVRSIVLVAPAGVGRDTLINLRLATVPAIGELLTRPSRIGLRMLWRLAFHDASFVTDELVETKYALASAPGAQAAFLKTLRGFLAFGGFPRSQLQELYAAMGAMKQPTLVVWGRQDRFLPVDHARLLEERLPACRLKLFDRCGHLPQIEHAAEFNDVVLEFLQESVEPISLLQPEVDR